jgi:hypothetical protein
MECEDVVRAGTLYPATHSVRAIGKESNMNYN